MSFDQSSWLLLLFLLVPLAFHSLYVFHKRKHALGQLCPGSGGQKKEQLLRDLHKRFWLAAFCKLLFWAFCIIALAGPYWGSRTIAEYRRGVDVVLALDISGSMNVRDSIPSRLDKSLSTAAELVRSSPGIRFAVVVGKGNGILAVPLTDDPESILQLLNMLGSSSLSAPGTNLEKLVDAGLAAFPDVFPTRKRIVLFSDGEALDGSLDAAAERLRIRQVGLISVGFGSVEGMPVPLAGTEDEFLRDEDNKAVISRLRPDVLRRASELTGERYFSGDRSDAAQQLVRHIAGLSAMDAMESFRSEARSRRSLFVSLALVFLALSRAAAFRYRRKT